ncbi:MAG: hypothetical protein EA397_19935 [Deltaproteobacteria bacterium]|nr:MAG: hypothetical protein EA397_19935 [Deltaproteobacteria bacterium]
MHLSRSMVLALSFLVAPLVLVGHVEPAAAQAPGPEIPPGGLVDILPPSQVIADGTRTYTGHVIALDRSGRPISGLKLKLNSSAGKIDSPTQVQPGVYAFSWTPAAVSSPQEVTLEIRTRTPDKVKVLRQAKVTLRPPTATGLQISSNPPQLVLGQDASGTISFSLDNAAGGVSASDIAVLANVGEVENITHLGGGKFTARYVTPKVNFPQLAIVSVVDLRNPDTAHGVVVIPLQGKVDYPVQATAGSSVIMRIGGRDFGPTPVDANGRAKVPVIVPPGIPMATKVEVKDGQTSEEELDLRVPETRRLSFLPPLRSVPADGATKVPVRIAVFTPEGQPDSGAKVSFSAEGGEVGTARSLGDGLFEVDFTPDFSNVAAQGKITASLEDSTVQTASLDVTLAPALPTRVELSTDPDPLDADTTEFKLVAKLQGPGDEPLSARELTLLLAGASLKGAVKDQGDGTYSAQLTSEEGAVVTAVSALKVSATGNPVDRILLIPSASFVPNNGADLREILLVSVDRYGYPVPGVEVGLKVEQGDGVIEETATTNEAGVAFAAYKAGSGVGVARIRATHGAHSSTAHLVQGPQAVSGAVVPVSADAHTLELIRAWSEAAQPLVLTRRGAPAAAAAPVVPEQPAEAPAETPAEPAETPAEPAEPEQPSVQLPDLPNAISSSGEAARLRTTVVPSPAPAGGDTTLTIDVLDKTEAGVTGASFDFLASAGTLGEPTELGRGRYQVVLAVPADAEGELKISVASGDVASFVKVPVGPPESAWGPTEPSATPVAPSDSATGTAQPLPPAPKPASDNDLTRIRVRGSYVASSYAYQQTPFTESGPLLPAILAVGGDEGGSAASPQGFEVAGRGFIHDYVGFDATARATSWSLTSEAFNDQKVPDVLFHFNADAILRYPFEASDNVFWVGGRLGYHGSDILYFTGDFDDGVVGYQSLFVQGLGFGAEVGAEVGDLYVHGALTGRLLGVTRWLATAVDAHVGYQITDQIFVDLGLGFVDRQVTLQGRRSGADLGELHDRQLMGRIGAGFRF